MFISTTKTVMNVKKVWASICSENPITLFCVKVYREITHMIFTYCGEELQYTGFAETPSTFSGLPPKPWR
jgi:hypothetical protein